LEHLPGLGDHLHQVVEPELVVYRLPGRLDVHEPITELAVVAPVRRGVLGSQHELYLALDDVAGRIRTPNAVSAEFEQHGAGAPGAPVAVEKGGKVGAVEGQAAKDQSAVDIGGTVARGDLVVVDRQPAAVERVRRAGSVTSS